MRALAGAPAAVAGVAALAAGALWALGASSWGPLLHGGHAHPGGPAPPLVAAAALAGWALMVLATMLPASSGALVRLAGARGWAVAGFLAAWCAAGALVVGVVAIAGAAAGRAGWDGPSAAVLAGAALLAAGAYQATPLKARCLARCRAHARARDRAAGAADPSGDALRAGVAHGLASLGCCWPLMALMALPGLGGLPGVLAVGGVAALEARGPAGGRLRLPLGAALAAAGALVLATGWTPGGGA